MNTPQNRCISLATYLGISSRDVVTYRDAIIYDGSKMYSLCLAISNDAFRRSDL